MDETIYFRHFGKCTAMVTRGQDGAKTTIRGPNFATLFEAPEDCSDALKRMRNATELRRWVREKNT